MSFILKIKTSVIYGSINPFFNDRVFHEYPVQYNEPIKRLLNRDFGQILQTNANKKHLTVRNSFEKISHQKPRFNHQRDKILLILRRLFQHL